MIRKFRDSASGSLSVAWSLTVDADYRHNWRLALLTQQSPERTVRFIETKDQILP